MYNLYRNRHPLFSYFFFYTRESTYMFCKCNKRSTINCYNAAHILPLVYHITPVTNMYRLIPQRRASCQLASHRKILSNYILSFSLYSILLLYITNLNNFSFSEHFLPYVYLIYKILWEIFNYLKNVDTFWFRGVSL